MNNNPDYISQTLAALMIFSDEFSTIMLNVGFGVVYYKTVVMLTNMKKRTTNKNDLSKIDDHIEFYRKQLFIIVSQIQDGLYEMGEEDDIFNFHFIRSSSKLIGKICDELMNKHGYGDVAILSENSNGIDLSDFFVPLDEDEEECENDDEADY